ncbi:MAG: glycosyltransferase family 39 protein [Candidatus Omnitrophota bacterium]
MKKNKYDVFYKLLKDNDLYVPVVLCLGAFLTRFGFLALSDNFKGPQPMLNIITSLHIFKYPGFMQNIYYQQLPVFLYSLFAVIKIGGDQILCGRLLSVFWGSISIAPFYYLISRIFTKKISAFSALLLCFYPVHVITSVITVPDLMGLFFLLSALCFLQEQRNVLSAVFICLATACTYVSWLFVFILPVFITAKKQSFRQGLKDALGFFLIASFFTLLWIMVTNNIYKEHNLFYKNFFEARSFFEYLFAFMQTVSMITRQLFSFPLPLLFLFGLAGIYQSAKMRKYYDFFFLIGALVLALAFGIFRQEINIIEQGLLILSIFLIPFIILGLDFILRVFRLGKNKYMAAALTMICFNMLFLSIYARPYLPKKIKDLSSWLKDNVQDTNAELFINKDNNPYFSSIIMLSRLPQGNFHYYKADDMDFLELKRDVKNYFIYSGAIDADMRENFIEAVRFDEYGVLTRLDKK